MGGEAVGSQGASGVKTKPSEPEHGGTENDKRYIVDPVGHVFISAAFSKKERKDKSADAGADVYDVSAGKIHRTDCGEKTALSPYHMRQRVIDDQRPQGCEQKQCFEFHTAHQGTCDQSRCDHGKHHLKGAEDQMRKIFCVRTGFHADAVQAEPAEISDDPQMVAAEGQRISEQSPHDNGKSHD